MDTAITRTERTQDDHSSPIDSYLADHHRGDPRGCLGGMDRLDPKDSGHESRLHDCYDGTRPDHCTSHVGVDRPRERHVDMG